MPTYRVTVPVHTSVVYEVEAECLAAVYGEIDAGHGRVVQAATVDPTDFDDDETPWQIEIVSPPAAGPSARFLVRTTAMQWFRYPSLKAAVDASETSDDIYYEADDGVLVWKRKGLSSNQTQLR